MEFGGDGKASKAMFGVDESKVVEMVRRVLCVLMSIVLVFGLDVMPVWAVTAEDNAVLLAQDEQLSDQGQASNTAIDIADMWACGSITIDKAGTYYLSRDVQTAGALTIDAPEGQTVALDLQGHEVTVAGQVAYGIDASPSKGAVKIYDSTYQAGEGDVPAEPAATLRVQANEVTAPVAGIVFNAPEAALDSRGNPTASLCVQDLALDVCVNADAYAPSAAAYAVLAGYSFDAGSTSVNVLLSNIKLGAHVQTQVGASEAERPGLALGVYAGAAGVNLNGSVSADLSSEGGTAALYSKVANAAPFILQDDFHAETQLSVYVNGNIDGTLVAAYNQTLASDAVDVIKASFIDSAHSNMVFEALNGILTLKSLHADDQVDNRVGNQIGNQDQNAYGHRDTSFEASDDGDANTEAASSSDSVYAGDVRSDPCFAAESGADVPSIHELLLQGMIARVPEAATYDLNALWTNSGTDKPLVINASGIYSLSADLTTSAPLIVLSATANDANTPLDVTLRLNGYTLNIVQATSSSVYPDTFSDGSAIGEAAGQDSGDMGGIWSWQTTLSDIKAGIYSYLRNTIAIDGAGEGGVRGTLAVSAAASNESACGIQMDGQGMWDIEDPVNKLTLKNVNLTVTSNGSGAATGVLYDFESTQGTREVTIQDCNVQAVAAASGTATGLLFKGGTLAVSNAAVSAESKESDADAVRVSGATQATLNGGSLTAHGCSDATAIQVAPGDEASLVYNGIALSATSSEADSYGIKSVVGAWDDGNVVNDIQAGVVIAATSTSGGAYGIYNESPENIDSWTSSVTFNAATGIGVSVHVSGSQAYGIWQSGTTPMVLENTLTITATPATSGNAYTLFANSSNPLFTFASELTLQTSGATGHLSMANATMHAGEVLATFGDGVDPATWAGRLELAGAAQGQTLRVDANGIAIVLDGSSSAVVATVTDVHDVVTYYDDLATAYRSAADKDGSVMVLSANLPEECPGFTVAAGGQEGNSFIFDLNGHNLAYLESRIASNVVVKNSVASHNAQFTQVHYDDVLESNIAASLNNQGSGTIEVDGVSISIAPSENQKTAAVVAAAPVVLKNLNVAVAGTINKDGTDWDKLSGIVFTKAAAHGSRAHNVTMTVSNTAFCDVNGLLFEETDDDISDSNACAAFEWDGGSLTVTNTGIGSSSIPGFDAFGIQVRNRDSTAAAPSFTLKGVAVEVVSHENAYGLSVNSLSCDEAAQYVFNNSPITIKADVGASRGIAIANGFDFAKGTLLFQGESVQKPASLTITNANAAVKGGYSNGSVLNAALSIQSSAAGSATFDNVDVSIESIVNADAAYSIYQLGTATSSKFTVTLNGAFKTNRPVLNLLNALFLGDTIDFSGSSPYQIANPSVLANDVFAQSVSGKDLSAFIGHFVPASASVYAGMKAAVQSETDTSKLKWDGVKVAKNTATGTEYLFFQSAIDSLRDGGAVELLADVEHAGQIAASSYDITINLNGHQLKHYGLQDASTNSYGVLRIRKNRTITIQDTSDSKAGTYTLIQGRYASRNQSGGAMTYYSRAVGVESGGSFILDGAHMVAKQGTRPGESGNRLIGMGSSHKGFYAVYGAHDIAQIALRNGAELSVDGAIENHSDKSCGKVVGIFLDSTSAATGDHQVNISANSRLSVVNNASVSEEGALIEGSQADGVSARQANLIRMDLEKDTALYNEVQALFQRFARYDDGFEDSVSGFEKDRNELGTRVYYLYGSTLSDGTVIWAYSDPVALTDRGDLSKIVATHVYKQSRYDTVGNAEGIVIDGSVSVGSTGRGSSQRDTVSVYDFYGAVNVNGSIEVSSTTGNVYGIHMRSRKATLTIGDGAHIRVNGATNSYRELQKTSTGAIRFFNIYDELGLEHNDNYKTNAMLPNPSADSSGYGNVVYKNVDAYGVFEDTDQLMEVPQGSKSAVPVPDAIGVGSGVDAGVAGSIRLSGAVSIQASNGSGQGGQAAGVAGISEQSPFKVASDFKIADDAEKISVMNRVVGNEAKMQFATTLDGSVLGMDQAALFQDASGRLSPADDPDNPGHIIWDEGFSVKFYDGERLVQETKGLAQGDGIVLPDETKLKSDVSVGKIKTFLGWSLTKDAHKVDIGAGDVLAGSSTMIAETERTYYAVYKKEGAPARVVFHGAKNADGKDLETVTVDGKVGETLASALAASKLRVPAASDYIGANGAPMRFVGWHIDSGEPNQTPVRTSDNLLASYSLEVGSFATLSHPITYPSDNRVVFYACYVEVPTGSSLVRFRVGNEYFVEAVAAGSTVNQENMASSNQNRAWKHADASSSACAPGSADMDYIALSGTDFKDDEGNLYTFMGWKSGDVSDNRYKDSASVDYPFAKERGIAAVPAAQGDVTYTAVYTTKKQDIKYGIYHIGAISVARDGGGYFLRELSRTPFKDVTVDDGKFHNELLTVPYGTNGTQMLQKMNELVTVKSFLKNGQLYTLSGWTTRGSDYQDSEYGLSSYYTFKEQPVWQTNAANFPDVKPSLDRYMSKTPVYFATYKTQPVVAKVEFYASSSDADPVATVGNVAPNTSIYDVLQTAGDPHPVSPDSARVFAGWSKDADATRADSLTLITAADCIDGDMAQSIEYDGEGNPSVTLKYYAVYEAAKAAKITFYDVKDDGLTVPIFGEADNPGFIEVQVGSTIGETKDGEGNPVAPINPSKDGTFFYGWNTSVDGTGEYYDFKSTIVPDIESLNLYAIYKPISSNGASTGVDIDTSLNCYSGDDAVGAMSLVVHVSTATSNESEGVMPAVGIDQNIALRYNRDKNSAISHYLVKSVLTDAQGHMVSKDAQIGSTTFTLPVSKELMANDCQVRAYWLKSDSTIGASDVQTPTKLPDGSGTVEVTVADFGNAGNRSNLVLTATRSQAELDFEATYAAAQKQIEDTYYQNLTANKYTEDALKQLKGIFEYCKQNMEDETLGMTAQEVADYANRVIANMNAVPIDNSADLTTARAAARESLMTSLETHDASNYSSENYVNLLKAYTDAKNAINNAGTTDAISQALRTGIDAMNAIPTNATSMPGTSTTARTPISTASALPGASMLTASSESPSADAVVAAAAADDGLSNLTPTAAALRNALADKQDNVDNQNMASFGGISDQNALLAASAGVVIAAGAAAGLIARRRKMLRSAAGGVRLVQDATTDLPSSDENIRF